MAAAAAGAFKTAHEAKGGPLDITSGKAKRLHPSREQGSGLRAAGCQIPEIGDCHSELVADPLDLPPVEIAEIVLVLPPGADACEQGLRGLRAQDAANRGTYLSPFCSNQKTEGPYWPAVHTRLNSWVCTV